VSGALDNSGELVWTQCSCATCDDDVTTPFNPALSTTVCLVGGVERIRLEPTHFWSVWMRAEGAKQLQKKILA
jgi:hypothetical protein